GAEVADRKAAGLRVRSEQIGDPGEAAGEQTDIEPETPGGGVRAFFLHGQQVDQQGGEPRLPERAGHESVARAVPAAARPVREENDAAPSVGDLERAFE